MNQPNKEQLELQIKLENAIDGRVELILDDQQPASGSSEENRNQVQEEQNYMPDFIFNEEGKLEALHYHKVKHPK